MPREGEAVAVGATGRLRHLVREEDGAARWGNDVPVLATPVLLWLGEIAAMRAVDEALGTGEMTVGRSHDAEHLAATPVGWTVEVTAVLAEVVGRSLHFTVQAHDGQDLVYRGTHVRARVSQERFLQRLADKSGGATTLRVPSDGVPTGGLPGR